MGERLNVRFQVSLTELYQLKMQLEQNNEELDRIRATATTEIEQQRERVRELEEWQCKYAEIYQKKSQEYETQIQISEGKNSELQEENARMKECKTQLTTRNMDLEREVQITNGHLQLQEQFRKMQPQSLSASQVDQLKHEIHNLKVQVHDLQLKDTDESRRRRRHESGPGKEELKASLERMQGLLDNLTTEKLALTSDMSGLIEENSRLHGMVSMMHEELEEDRQRLTDNEGRHAMEKQKMQEKLDMALELMDMFQRNSSKSQMNLNQIKQKLHILGLEEHFAVELSSREASLSPTPSTSRCSSPTPQAKFKRFRMERTASTCQCKRCCRNLTLEDLANPEDKCRFHPFKPMDYGVWRKVPRIGKPPTDPASYSEYRYYFCCSKFGTKRPPGCQQGKHDTTL